MPTLTDIFTPDGFGTYALTAAIQRFPHAPTIINNMGLFREIPVNSTNIVIEEQNGMLTLVPTTKRGGPGIPSQDPKRAVRSFRVPHIQLDDAVMADDALNVRSFGSADAMSGVGEIISRKLETMRRSIDVTDEWLRSQALNGIIVYPTGSVDATLNLFTEFGTSLQTVALLLSTSTTAVAALAASIRDAIETAMGSTPYTGIVCLCSKLLFRSLIAHALVRTFYADFQKMYNLNQVTFVEKNRRVFEWENITWVEMSDAPVSNKYLYGGIASGEGTAFPIGADIFHSYIAPADIVEAAGTLGQSVYARQYIQPDGKSVNLEVQRNALSLCTRPRALIHIDYNT